MSIEQIYCTHCTYGASALEQREGELAERVLGYSARAGSLERNELRNDYRSIERFLYYYLPADTPPEEKQRLDAAGAPRRLFLCPSMGKLQMVGQVAYRQYDTAGRLGSYFAHVLFNDREKHGAWSAVDCLRLWNAPWVQEDSPAHPYKLPSLSRLDNLWAGAAPAIGDDSLLRFLQGAVGPADGDEVATQRWQTAPVQKRIELLVHSLQGLLALGAQRRENVLLVVEPSIAALIFYGIARLLPKSLSEGLSFSTYEPNAERLPAILAATTFFEPETTDVRPDLYRRRGLVINTYLDRMSDAGAPAGDYARFIVERLLEEGWPTVDRLLESFEEAGAKRPEDLEIVPSTHHVVSQVLSATPPEDNAWRHSPVAAKYLTREVQYQLAAAPAGWPQLKSVIGTPNHLTVLELLATEGTPSELQRPAQFLLKKFPPEQIAELVSSPFILRSAKLEALLNYVTALGCLPEGCQLLPAEGSGLRARAAMADSLLPDLLGKLPEPVLRRLYDTIGDGRRMAFFQALAIACRRQVPACESLKRLLLDGLTQLDDAQWLDALATYREDFGAVWPPPQPALASRLGRALHQLPEHAKNFEKWLAALDQWKAYFPHPNLAERRLAEWAKVRSCLLALGAEQPRATSGVERFKNRLHPPRPPDLKPLAQALDHAMPRRSCELDELAGVVETCGLNLRQFKERLQLEAQRLGLPLSYKNEPADVDDGELFGGPGDELQQQCRRREQQARMGQLLRELEERLLVYADNPEGHGKLAALQKIGQVLVGRPDFLGEGKARMELYFVNGLWPTAAMLSPAKNKLGYKPRRKRRSRWAAFAGVGVSIAVFVPLVGYLLFTQGSGNRSPAKAVQKKAQRAETGNPANNAAKENLASAGRMAPGGGQAKSNDKTDASASPIKQNESGSSTKATIANSAPPPSANDVPSSDMPEEQPEAMHPPTDAAAETVKDKVQPGKTSPAPPDENHPTSISASLPSRSQRIFQMVEKAMPLPAPGARLFDRIELESWSQVPAGLTLKLYGLKAAEDQIGGGMRLACRFQSDTLPPQLLAEARDSNESRTLLATFTAEDKRLSFQWAKLDEDTPKMRKAREAIRHCVLEIGGDKPALIALSAPRVVMEPLSLEVGRGIVERRDRAAHDNAGISDDLILGYGSITLQTERRFKFDGPLGAAPYVLQDLPAERQSCAAVVELTRDKNQDLEVRIVLQGRTASGSGAAAILDNPQARKKFSDALQRLRGLSGSGQISEPPTEATLKEVDALVKQLAAIVDLSEEQVPTLRGSSDDKKERRKYKQAIDKTLIPAADQFEQQLTDLNWLRQHAAKLTAVIYRRIDKGMYARHIVFGDPGPPPDEAGAAETGDADLDSEN